LIFPLRILKKVSIFMGPPQRMLILAGMVKTICTIVQFELINIFGSEVEIIPEKIIINLSPGLLFLVATC